MWSILERKSMSVNSDFKIDLTFFLGNLIVSLRRKIEKCMKHCKGTVRKNIRKITKNQPFSLL